MPSSIIGFKDVLLLVIDFDFEMGYLPAVTLLFPILKFLTFWNNNIDGRPGRQRLAVEQEEEKKLKKNCCPIIGSLKQSLGKNIFTHQVETNPTDGFVDKLCWSIIAVLPQLHLW